MEWHGLRPAVEAPADEGLRERKKRQLRQQLSDAATVLFLERGFDAVRVADVAEACGVSEKTVFNYFPTKEALVLDLWDAASEALRGALADPAVDPVEATVGILAEEIGRLTDWLAGQDDRAHGVALVVRFGALIRSTPGLRAHQRDRTDQLIDEVASCLAARAGARADDPEPRIAAIGLVGLWDVQFASLRRNLRPDRTPAAIRDAVTADVRLAAHVLATGISH